MIKHLAVYIVEISGVWHDWKDPNRNVPRLRNKKTRWKIGIQTKTFKQGFCSLWKYQNIYSLFLFYVQYFIRVKIFFVKLKEGSFHVQSIPVISGVEDTISAAWNFTSYLAAKKYSSEKSVVQFWKNICVYTESMC